MSLATLIIMTARLHLLHLGRILLLLKKEMNHVVVVVVVVAAQSTQSANVVGLCFVIDFTSSVVNP